MMVGGGGKPELTSSFIVMNKEEGQKFCDGRSFGDGETDPMGISPQKNDSALGLVERDASYQKKEDI